MTSNKRFLSNSLLEEVITVAKSAGEFIHREALRFKSEKVREKSFNQLVSYVDEEAERQIVDQLSKLLPEAGFITEEDTIKHEKKTLEWVIDPLDGTTNFIHGIPFYSVSIALVENSIPVLGVIYEVHGDHIFYAEKGGGAFLDDEKIQCSSNLLSDSLIATGFPFHSFDEQEKYLNIFGSFMRTCRGMRRMGSAALDLAYVAAGRFDGFFEYDLNFWDVAAGIIILEEAGGKIGRFSGESLDGKYNEILAANPKVWTEMIELIEKGIKGAN